MRPIVTIKWIDSATANKPRFQSRCLVIFYIWSHSGFEPAENIQLANLDEAGCQICCTKVCISRGNMSNLGSHLWTWQQWEWRHIRLWSTGSQNWQLGVSEAFQWEAMQANQQDQRPSELSYGQCDSLFGQGNGTILHRGAAEMLRPRSDICFFCYCPDKLPVAAWLSRSDSLDSSAFPLTPVFWGAGRKSSAARDKACSVTRPHGPQTWEGSERRRRLRGSALASVKVAEQARAGQRFLTHDARYHDSELS